MKKIFLLCLAILSFSCSNDDDQPQPQIIQVKVIDKIKVEESGSNSLSSNTLMYEYDSDKRISKITHSTLINPNLKNITFTYENGIPKSSVRTNGDVSTITYSYNGNVLRKYHDAFYDEIIVFNHDANYNSYSSSDIGLNFYVNNLNDVSRRTYYSNVFDYSFDTNKKGPLYNVASKEYMPTLINAMQFTHTEMFFQSIYPVNAIFDDNTQTLYPFTNQYDTEGFVIQSDFVNTSNNVSYKVTYTYKNI
ncbi:hypothetical protein [Flavobacterium sp. U410]